MYLRLPVFVTSSIIVFGGSFSDDISNRFGAMFGFGSKELIFNEYSVSGDSWFPTLEFLYS